MITNYLRPNILNFPDHMSSSEVQGTETTLVHSLKSSRPPVYRSSVGRHAVMAPGSQYRPAVDHHWPGVGHGLGLDPADEAQQPCGVVGHAVVRPAREVELSYLPDLVSASLWWPEHEKDNALFV